MSSAEIAIERGRSEGAFAAIAELAKIRDVDEAAEAFHSALRTAYWEDKDLTLTTAIAYAGAGRLLAAAERLDHDHAAVIRSVAKALMYDLASFTWPGWDEPGIDISPTDAAGGLAAARSNLAMAVALDKGDLAVSRAHWMIGAHLLAALEHDAAASAFEASVRHAATAGATAEGSLGEAFAELARLARGDGSEEALAAALDRLRSEKDGDAFVAQVTTARHVLGV